MLGSFEGNIIAASPESTLDYVLNWTQWLQGGETITNVSIDTPAIYSSVNTGSTVTVWFNAAINNAVEGKQFAFNVIITTTAGRIDARQFNIYIKAL